MDISDIIKRCGRIVPAIVVSTAFSTIGLSSSVPIRWTVETSRVQPAVFDAYHGETLELDVTMMSYGKAFEFVSGDARLFWQTNGMGNAWWSAPAEIRTDDDGVPDGYKATWIPEYDVGSDVYNCIIGQASGNYRAEFRIRMRHSPGARPNTLALPQAKIDFAEVDVTNAPWLAMTDTVGRAETVGTAEKWTDADGIVRSITRSWQDNGPGEPLWTATFRDGNWFFTSYGGNEFSTERTAQSGTFHGNETRVLVDSGVLMTCTVETNIIGRVAFTNETMTAHGTETSIRLLNDMYPGMRVAPPTSENIIPSNQFRGLVLGDDKTVALARYIEADRLLVSSPDTLMFVARREILQDGTTNYVLKSFSDYLKAVSPTAVNELIGAYLPTNGGGTVTGELNVEGDVHVSGVLDAPRLLRVVTSDIEARGFTVSNGVLRSANGIVVSNGMCTVKFAKAEVGVVAPRFHVEGGEESITLGGTYDYPDVNLKQYVLRLIENKLYSYGLDVNLDDMPYGPSLGAITQSKNDLATKADVLALAPVNATQAVEDRRSSPTSNNGILRLRNNCVNVIQNVLDCNGVVHVYFPFIGDHATWDMGQRIHLGIYFPRDMSARSILWDYPADDGGYSFVGESGEELTDLRGGDLLWFQQVGLHELAVRKTHYGAVIEVEHH